MALSGQPVGFVHVKDRAEALAFYRDTLGLTVTDSDDYGDFLNVGGGLLRLTVISDYQPHAHPVFGWNVADMDATVRTLKDNGVGMLIYDGMGMDEFGVWTAPDGGKVAWFADPFGNMLMLSQS